MIFGQEVYVINDHDNQVVLGKYVGSRTGIVTEKDYVIVHEDGRDRLHEIRYNERLFNTLAEAEEVLKAKRVRVLVKDIKSTDAWQSRCVPERAVNFAKLVDLVGETVAIEMINAAVPY